MKIYSEYMVELDSESSLAVPRANTLESCVLEPIPGASLRAQDFSGPRAFFGCLLILRVELPNIFAKPVPGAQAQIQEDFVGKAATLWPDSKHVPGGSKGLGGWGLGNR